jgi:hypothetical protein
MRRESDFDKLLLRTIDNSLKEVFTENAALAIYAYLESSYALNQENIPEKLDLFVDGLHKFLSTGAFTVERVILENLHSKLELEHELGVDCDFKNSIAQLKNSLKLK